VYAEQQAFNTQVFIKLRPMDAFTIPEEFVLPQLGRRCVS
jgi:hypothetical protein